MFTDAINDLTICGDEASSVFPNILKTFEHPDNSFLATLRALLPKRMPSGDELRFGLIRLYHDSTFHSKNSKAKIHSIFRQALAVKGSLIFISLDSDANDILKLLERKTSDEIPELRFAPEVSYYLSQKGCQMAAFTSEADKISVVVGVSITLKDWHYAQSVIPRLLPWYFTEPRTDDDNAVLNALTQKSSHDYISILERISLGMDLRVVKIRKMLSGLAREFMRSRIANTEKKIKDLEDEIERLNQSLSEKITDMFETKTTLCGLQNMDGPHDKELADFFINNKSLHVISSGQGSIEYIVTGYLTSYDQLLFENSVNNESSSFRVLHPGAIITAEDTMKLVKAIFNPAPQCKLRVYAGFSLKLDSSLNAIRHYNFPLWLNNYFPHPHIDRGACLGGNSQYIHQAMANQDYVTAVTQTMAAVRNIHFGDGVVVPHFVKVLQTIKNPCIEMRDGRIVSPAEAVKLLDRMER